MSATVTIQQGAPSAFPEGLKDGGHVLIECSNCRAILLDVWRTRPHEPHTWKLKAHCPFCDDESFIKDIEGGFHVGGYGVLKDGEDDDDVPSTVVDCWELRGDVFYYKVNKANENAKPVFGI